MLDWCNQAPQKHSKQCSIDATMLPKNMKQWGFSWLKMAWKCSLRGAPFLGKMPVSDGVCCTKMGDECCGDGRKNDDRYRKKNQRLQSVSWIIGFVFYWYTVFLWNQWKLRANIVEIKMMTVFRKMMTQSVKIVKLKEVKWLVFNVLIINDDNDSLKKIWAHTIGG